MGPEHFEGKEIPEMPSTSDSKWHDLESERPSEIELPNIETDGQDVGDKIEWKADDAEREITELPRVQELENGMEVKDETVAGYAEGAVNETENLDKRDGDGVKDLPGELSLHNDDGKNDADVDNNEVDSESESKQSDTESETRDNNELEEKKGGSYRDVKKTSDGETHEVHHMPANSTSKLETDDGPAIKMEKEDHRQTASCGNSREAREYREKQKELIEQGKFREALQMDIDDLHEKFGDKYDDAISEMLDYVDQLEEEGKI